MKLRHLLGAAATGATFAAASAACAQSIDYGSLQQMFNEPVTTSATGSPLRSTDVPVDMTIITAEDIKRSGATDLPTILSRVPGIDILNWSAQDTDVSVRGYDQAYSPRLLVLIDGRQVYLDHYGYTNWASLPVTMNEIRQIEVVRGPNSALFGFNAVGGVVNIITYNPKYDNARTAEVHGGTQDEVGGSLVETLHLGSKISARVSAGGERQNEWRNSSQFPMAWNAHASADTVVQLASNTELRLEGSYSRNHDVDVAVNYIPGNSLYKNTSGKATLISDTPFGQIQAQSYINDLENTFGLDLGTLIYKNQVEVASLQDLFKVGTRNTFRVAIEYRDNRLNATPLGSAHIDYNVWSPSAMWNLAATSKLSLTAAGRVDYLSLGRTGLILPVFGETNAAWNRTLTELSANVGAVYKFSPVDTARASYARGVQVPTLVEYGGFQFVVPHAFGFQGNPDLKAAIVSNYELSYDRDLPALSAKASGKVFFQQTDDVKGAWDASRPEIAPTATTVPLTLYENASTSQMTGFELSASGKISGDFHWSADTTYTNVSDSIKAGYTLIGRHVDFAATTPKFRGNVAAGWSNARWMIDGYIHYVSDYQMYQFVSPIAPVSGYVTLAGRVAYRLPDDLVLALSGQNLGTERQLQSGPSGLVAPRRVLLGVSKSW